MPDLSYPFAFKCSNCDRETTVTRSDARGLYSDPNSYNAVTVVLEQRGWVRGKREEVLFCPTCVGGAH